MDEVIKNKDFEKSVTEKETYESIKKLKYLQENDDGGNFVLDHLIGKKRTILVFKWCSNNPGIVHYFFS